MFKYLVSEELKSVGNTTTQKLISELCSISGVVFEGKGKKKDDDEGGARAETVKGQIESLAKRMAGLTSLIDDEKKGAAVTALKKILQDGEALLEKIDGTEGKPETEKKKDPKREQEPEKGEVPTPADKDKQQQMPSEQPQQAFQAQAQPQQQPQGHPQLPSESVIHAGQIIHRGAPGDPIGLGRGLVESLKQRMGPRTPKPPKLPGQV